MSAQVEAKLEAQLLEEVRSLYGRYVVFHADLRDAEADCVALWTLHTWTLEAAETTPYLLVHAPTPEAGKSRVVEVAQHLAWRPEVVHDPSPASLFRMIDSIQPTLLIDEVDVLRSSRPLQAVLNAGYRVGGSVTRSVRIGGDWVPQAFSCFCPKMLAGIAGERLPIRNATLSRCIQLPMQRKASWETAERFFHGDVRRAAAPLLDGLLSFRAVATEILAPARPAMPSALSDRQEESWLPLVAIADAAGGSWPDRARAAAVALSAAASGPPDPGCQCSVISSPCSHHEQVPLASSDRRPVLARSLERSRYHPERQLA